MEIASLSEIFDDPLLNEFTDDLLKDIDISDLQFLHGNFENSSVAETDGLSTPDHCTLEALLKSQKPLSCVPPAPELRSELNAGNARCTLPQFQDSAAQFRRNSLPILKHDYESSSSQDKGIYPPSRSKLISDYLGKRCDVFDTTVASRFREGEQNGLTSERGISKKFPPSDSFSGDSATDSPEQRADISNGIRCTKLSPASERDSYSCQIYGDGKNVRRAPHNAIEKRYRASINGRIDELRNLLIPYPNSETKLNKSAVLRQAIERIKELEETTARLQSELMTLRSVHSSDHMKPCHSSPESGISSASGSSYSGLDGTGLTPPNGISNGAAHHIPIDSSSVMYVTKDIANSAIEATDIYTWAPEVPPAASFVDFPDSGFAYPHHVSHTYEVNSAELTETSPNQQIVQDEDGHLWRSHSGISLTTPTTTGANFKRRAVSIHPGPTKVRRSMIVSSEYPAPRPPSVPNLVRSTSLLVKACTTPNPASSTPAFSFVRRASQSGTPSVELSAAAPVTPDVPTVGSGMNGWAARTTLCMTALSLIALDPVVLSGTAGDTTTSSSIPEPSSRRLLSALNTYGQTPSPWIVWLVYAVQWIVALCLCLWACRTRSQRVARTGVESERAPAQNLWGEARKAISQNSWSLAERKLSACLATLDPEPRSISWTTSAPSTIAHKLFHQFHCLVDWLGLCTHIAFGMFLRAPLLMLLGRFSTHNTHRKDDRPTSDSPPSKLTLANVRSSLVELYLLAPQSSLDYCPRLGLSFAYLRFLWSCVNQFMHDCVALFCGRAQSRGESDSVDMLLRRGIALVLFLRQSGSTRFTELSCAFKFVLQRCIRHLSRMSDPQALWARITTDPVLWNLVTGPGHRLVISSNQTIATDPNEDLFMTALRRALEQKLMDQCSRAIAANRQLDGVSDLDGALTTLLGLCSAAATTQGKTACLDLPSHVSDNDIQASWWAHVIQALRITREQSISELPAPSSPEFAVPALPVPPPMVLQCPRTGLLAQSVCLVYCPSSTLDVVESAHRCALGLCQYVKQLSTGFATERLESAGPVLIDCNASPYWILLCAQTVADRTLNTLARSLLALKPCSTHGDTEVLEPCELIESFNAAFWVLRQSSTLLELDQSDWVVKKISYYETVRRLLSGANPVHSRFSLMHAYRDMMMHRPGNDAGQQPSDLISKRPTSLYTRNGQQG